MVETTRLFVGNIPFGITEPDLKDAFSPYGKVISTEVKQKKDVYENGEKKGFAFITLEASSLRIDECIHEFSNNEWYGEKVYVSRARESFMDRLKKEREEAKKIQTTVADRETKNDCQDGDFKHHPVSVAFAAPRKIKYDISNEGDEELESKKRKKIKTKHSTEDCVPLPKQINLKKDIQVDPKLTASHAKRLQSMKEMRNTYNLKKSAIKQSLSNVDKNINTKIKFDSSGEDDDNYNSFLHTGKKTGRSENNKVSNEHPQFASEKPKHLFDKSSDDSDDELNFNVKKQFEGHKGQKLLELQSRYKSDKRFTLDERFLDEGEMKDSGVKSEDEGIDLAADDEKTRNLNILQDVLGFDLSRPKRLTSEENSTRKKSMFRFDPTLPEHEKFIHIKGSQPNEVPNKSKKERRKEREQLRAKKEGEKTEKMQTDSAQASQKTFYSMNMQFGKTSDHATPFSLLDMFGSRNVSEDYNDGTETKEYPVDAATPTHKISKHALHVDNMKNPFKYDSSDSENEKDEKDIDPKSAQKTTVNNSKSEGSLQFDTFFFVKNDKRLKEGLEFFADTSTNRVKMRREMRQIMKKRLSNNERKNSKRLFKKKIGGRKHHQGKRRNPRSK